MDNIVYAQVVEQAKTEIRKMDMVAPKVAFQDICVTDKKVARFCAAARLQAKIKNLPKKIKRRLGL